MKVFERKSRKRISGGMDVCVCCVRVYTYVFCMYVNCLGQGKKAVCIMRNLNKACCIGGDIRRRRSFLTGGIAPKPKG